MTSTLDRMQYIANGVQQGYQRGQQNKLAQISAEAYGAPQPQRQALIQEAIGTDPQYGMELGQQMQGQEDRLAKSAANAAQYLLRAHESKNPQAVQGAYAATVPLWQEFARMKGVDREIPQQFDEAMLPMLHEIVATAGGGMDGGANVQSTYVRQDGMRVAIMRDGSQQELGMAAESYSPVNMGNRVDPFNKRTGTFGAGGQVATPQSVSGANVPSSFTDSTGATVDISGIDDPELRAQIAANPQAFEASIETGQRFTPSTIAIPQGMATGGQPSNVMGMSPSALAAERRAAIDDARADRMEDRQWRADQRDEARFQREQAKPAASPAMQKEAAARRAKIPQLQNAIRGLDRIEQALSGLNGGLVNTGPVDAMVQRYTPAGQELDSAVGAIQNSVLALTRVPGIGAQSDLEARIASLQYPSLDKPPEVNRRTLNQLKLFMRDLAKAYESATQDDAAPAASRQPAPSNGGFRILD